jgi:hypothetical protein
MRKKTPRLLPLTMGVCLCLVPAAVGRAQMYYPGPAGPYPGPYYAQAYYPQPYCPQPGPPPGYCPPPGYPAPGPMAPPAGTPPSAEKPPEKPGPGERQGTQRPDTQQTRPQDQAPQTPETNAPETSTNAAAGTGAEGAGAGAEAGAEGSEAGAAESAFGGTGAGPGGGMLGRGDGANRFNLFDNMTPYLANRVWFAYQLQDGFNTGVQALSSNPGVTSGFASRRNENLYRFGGELVPMGESCFGPNFSVAFQTQYIGSTNTTDAADAWGNPEAMVKLLVSQSCSGAWALSLGIQPQTASHNGELHEKSTRILPGVLFSQAVGCGLFVQGGMQLGISDRNDTNTLDYSLSFGYNLYACPASDSPACGRPLITALIPQVEFYGANVLANDTSNPFELQGNPMVPGSSAPYREPRNVFDMTFGGHMILRDCVSIGTGYSFPLSGPNVRRSELITSLTILF